MTGRGPVRTVAAVPVLLAISLAGRAWPAEQPDFDKLVDPLRAEAGPLISPPIGAVPSSGAWAGLGFLYGRRDVGRTEYRLIGTRLVLGGEWSPIGLGVLGIGASLVALQTTTLDTRLETDLDDWRTALDLGELRVHVRFMALRLTRGIAEIALTPFFRLGLPTDTSRTNWERDQPLRRVLDDRVALAPYFLIEPGVSFAVTMGPATLYTHQAPILSVIHEEKLHFLWSMHFGVGFSIAGILELVAEASGLLRATRDYRDRHFHAFALCPGIRVKKGPFSYEISSRIGLTPDAYHAYGDFTVAFVVAWHPAGKAK